MKPATSLLPLLTVAVAGVGFASARFVTSTITTHVQPPHISQAAALQARQQGNVETFHETITRTVSQNGRGSSERPRPSTSNSNDGDNNSSSGSDQTITQDDPPPASATNTNPDHNNSSTLSLTTSSPPTAASISTSSTADQPKPNPGSSLSAGMAAGIAAGAVACLALLAAIAFLFWRRRQGGIRGAVVTAEYPRDMAEAMETSDPKLPPASPDVLLEDGGGGGGGERYDPAGGGLDSTEGDLGARGGGDGSDTNGQTPPSFRIPPAGTMPGELGFQQLAPPPQQQAQHQPHQSWLPGGDLSDPRPVSAFTTHPSPGQPVFPVSPMTPYYQRPESFGPAAAVAAGGPQYQQQQQQQQQQDRSHCRRSFSYPDSRSPDLPAFMIPGGNRSRAMSFSSVSRVDGGPGAVPRLVGSPPPPVPSMAVIEGGRASVRRSRMDYGR